MNRKKIKVYIATIGITEFVGFISGIITRDGSKIFSETIVKPFLTPPAIVFPIAWVILYALMGLGLGKVLLTGEDNDKKPVILYSAQLFMNFCWSILFFNRQMYGFSLLWLIVLWILILFMTISFYKVNKTAGIIQIPYIIWVTFAAYLNFGVWILN